MLRGPAREIARGGAAAGKKLGHDGFVRAGDVHRSNAKAGVRPQRRTAADLSVPCTGSIARTEEALCKVQSRSVRLRSRWDREAAKPDLDAEADRCLVSPHVMGQLAGARDTERCVPRRGVAIRYFDNAP
jgi:hypothetical protein